QEQGVAQVRRLHRHQSDRGAGGDRRQHRPLRGAEQPGGHRPPHQPRGGLRDRPPDPPPRPGRDHRHRPHRHGRAGPSRGGLLEPGERDPQGPREDQGAEHLRVRPGRDHPQAEPRQPGAPADPALSILLRPRPHQVDRHHLSQPAQGAPAPARAGRPERAAAARPSGGGARPPAGGAGDPRGARALARRRHPPPERPRAPPRALRRPGGLRPVAADAESFAAGAWTGEIGVRLRPADPAALAREVCRLVDPASAEKTLHWGRNYLYVARFAAADGPVEVAVKQFRRSSLRDRLRRRESKAARSWRAARALAAAGLATPEPVMLVESARAGGPSFYVCRSLEETLEARYLFRAANAGELSARFPGLDFPAYLDALGRTLRRLHDAGFWHRDMTGGNLLLPADQAGAPRDLYLLDLNRARLGRPPTVSERTRDLCRLALDRGEHQEALLAAYWGDGFPAWKGGLYDAYRRAFLAKNAGKLRLRRVFGRLRGRILPRGAHVHIPATPAE